MLCLLLLLFKLTEQIKWGVSTAAYQIEGGSDERGKHMWDIFSHTPGKVHNNDTGDIADDSYHRWEEDLDLVKDLAVDFYRFSIQWPRIYPTEEELKNRTPNQKGVDYYNNVINGLVSRGIEPFVTFYHWDLPTYTDWLNKDDVVEAFGIYTDTCFELFGDRVKYWLTLNEPWTYAVNGYDAGVHAPGRCSDRSRCEEGDSSTEGYLVAHHSILAHAHAYRIYEQKYKQKQGGQVGIVLNYDWAEPYSQKPEDVEAAERNSQFKISWFADPIWFGDYPGVMKEYVGDRLPKFSDEEKKIIKGTHDFFGLNHYSTNLVYAKNNSEKSWFGDQELVMTFIDSSGKPIGKEADSPWLYVVPWGIRKVINWVSDRYDHPAIYLCENGVDVPNESSIPLPDVLHDDFRIEFYSGYLENLKWAVEKDGCNVQAYFAWSVVDNFEWADGYDKRFGLVYIDRTDDLKRHPKDSYYWYKNHIAQDRALHQEEEV